MKIKIFFSLLSFFIINNSFSYIIDVTKLRDPQSDKNIVLCGDLHFCPKWFNNFQQKKAIFRELNKIINDKNYTIISEGCSKRDFGMFEKNKNDVPIFYDIISNNKYRDKIIIFDKTRLSGLSNFLSDYNRIINSDLSFNKKLVLMDKMRVVSLNEIAKCKQGHYSKISSLLTNNLLIENSLICNKISELLLLFEDIEHVLNNMDLNILKRVNCNFDIFKFFKEDERYLGLVVYILSISGDIDVLLSLSQIENKNVILLAGYAHTCAVKKVLSEGGYKEEYSDYLKINNSRYFEYVDLLDIDVYDTIGSKIEYLFKFHKSDHRLKLLDNDIFTLILENSSNSINDPLNVNIIGKKDKLRLFLNITILIYCFYLNHLALCEIQ